MTTRLLYMKDMYTFTSQAHVLDVTEQDNIHMVVLDQTIFYPQGGGQPADKGIIKNEKTSFEVHKVFFKDGLVYHCGIYKGEPFFVGESVELEVDASLRHLHNRLHTAGHIIDYALYNLGYRFTRGKSYHFAHGPYVEYEEELTLEDREKLYEILVQEVNHLVKGDCLVRFIHENEKQYILLGDFVPTLCGGTHVKSSKEVGEILIRKIKKEKGNLRISYALADN